MRPSSRASSSRAREPSRAYPLDRFSTVLALSLSARSLARRVSYTGRKLWDSGDWGAGGDAVAIHGGADAAAKDEREAHVPSEILNCRAVSPRAAPPPLSLIHI